MRRSPPFLLLLLLLLHLLCLYTNPASTSPVSRKAEAPYANLFDRSACGTYCGFSSQLCCSAGSPCYTDQFNQAQCSPPGDNPATTAAPATAAAFVATSTSTVFCDGNLGQNACGGTCCNAGQTCLSPGQCGGAGATAAATMVTSLSVATAAAAAGGASTPATVTTTAAVTTVTSGSSTTMTGNTGLDSGSIAGIVIGVIVGVLVLGWMCKPLTNRNKSEKISSTSSRSSRGAGSRRSKR